MATRIGTEDLLGGNWWLKKQASSMPTVSRDGTRRESPKPGISESELNEFQGQEQEPFGPAKEPTKKQYEAIAARRANTMTPEVTDDPDKVVKPPVNDRQPVDESKVTDPKTVQSLTKLIKGDEGGAAEDNTDGAGNAAATGKVSSYDDILAMMRANTVNEAEQARLQRNRETIAGVGDLISGIANLWATAKGAPSSYDNSKGMSATAQARYERALAQRKALNDQIMNYYRVRKAADDEAMDREYKRARIKYYEEEAKRKQDEIQAKKDRDEREQERKDREQDRKDREQDRKDEEQNRKNKDSDNKRVNENRKTEAYVNKVEQGTGKTGTSKSTKKNGKQKKATSGNTPPHRLAKIQSQNQNNTRPSKQK